MILAFLYRTYYCWGPKSCFVGAYDDTDDALAKLRGHEDETNLELIDTETYQITKYVWQPTYRHIIVASEKEEYVHYRWDKQAPLIRVVWDGPLRRYNEHNDLVYGGKWYSEDQVPDEDDLFQSWHKKNYPQLFLFNKDATANTPVSAVTQDNKDGVRGIMM
jgi:hypothetical protein